MPRNWSKIAIALCVMPVASAAWAADSSAASSSVLTAPLFMDATTEPATAPAAAATPTTLTPIMYEIDGTSVGKFMADNHLAVTGFVDAGYFYDTSNPRLGTGPRGDSPTYIVYPGFYSNRGLLDQLDVSVSKTIDATKSWDWGFLFENGYGTDDTYNHSDGLLDNRPGGHPQNQYDIVQADASLLVPIGSGLTITAGKFVGFLSEELINPTANLFYTHSYNFFYGVPATNTGIIGSYTFAKAFMGSDVTVLGGITRGWNQNLRDNNGAIDFDGELKTNITSKLAAVLNFEEGPEAAKDNSDYWSTAEAILTYSYSDQLTLSGDFLYSDFPHGSAIDTGSAAQWYGAALYANYKCCQYAAFNLRGEWFRDQGAFATGNEANYYEATAGVQIHPFPTSDLLQWLQFRPEVRYDWADRPVYNLSHNGGGGDYSEFTVAMDALMQF